MRILVAPFIDRSEDSSSYLLAQSLIDTYQANDHTVGVSVCKGTSLHNAEIFSCPLPKKSLFGGVYASPSRHTYEDFQTSYHCMSASYLEKDLNAMLYAIDQFHPERIFVINRLAAVMAARIRKIPYDAFISPAMYRSTTVPSGVLSGINKVLRKHKLEQILRLTDLYEQADHRYVFGSETLEFFQENVNITRLGSMMPITPDRETTTNVTIFLRDTGLSSGKLRALLEETFFGASYKVNLFMLNGRSGTQKNVQWLSNMKPSLIPGSAIVIHDGSEYLFNYCMMLGIPQLVIHDGSCLRSWTAFNVQRSGIGIAIPAKEASVASVYEAYRRILSDDYYRKRAGMYRAELLTLPDITSLSAPLPSEESSNRL